MLCTTCGRQLAPTTPLCPSCGMPTSATPSAPNSLAAEPRSATVAGIREWLMPGSGLRYAGRVRLGDAVRVWTLLGTLVLAMGLLWYDGFFYFLGLTLIPVLSIIPAPPSPTPEFGTLRAVFWVAFGLELLWVLVRSVWAARLVLRQQATRPRSMRVLTREEAATGVRALRVVSLVALVSFALGAGLYLVAAVMPGSGGTLAGVLQYALVLGGSVAFVAALMGARDMVRVRGGTWRTVGIAVVLLALVLDAVLVPFLFGFPSDLSLVAPMHVLLPAILPLLTLAYALYSVHQRPLVQPTGG